MFHSFADSVFDVGLTII